MIKQKTLVLLLGVFFTVVGVISIFNDRLFHWSGSPLSKSSGPPILYLLLGLIIVFFTLKNWKKI